MGRDGRSDLVHRPRGSIAQAFADSLESFGDAPAVIQADGTEVSYRELARIADSTAACWGAARKLVLIEAGNELEPIAAYLGALRAQHPVILTAPSSDQKLARLLDRFKPDIRYLHSPAGWISVPGESAAHEPFHPDLALLLPTSGSTGEPRLVRLSHENINSNARVIARYLDLADDRAITSLPCHYSYGLSVINSHLASGCALVLSDKSIVDEEFWAQFDRHGCTSFAGVPYSFELLERSGFLDRGAPRTLRYFTLAGGRLAPPRVKLFSDWAFGQRVSFFVMYGQTEAAPRIAYLPPELASTCPDSVGRAVPGGSLSVIDAEGKEIIDSPAVGELVYRGPNVMMGYALNRADLVRNAEVTELRTGDLAWQDAQGLFRIVGRASRFSKLFGLRISLDDLEDELRSVGIDARVAGDDALIAVMTRSGVNAADVREMLGTRLGLPRTTFVILATPDYPLLPSGKIDYATILGRACELRLKEAEGPASDPVVASGPFLRGRFAHLLALPEIDGDLSYIELGADSLTFVQAAMLVEEELGYLPEDWENRPIAELERLPSRSDPQQGPMVRWIDTSVVLRALAILGVVLTHANWEKIAGGAYLLLVLAGSAFARFHQDRLIAGRFVAASAPLCGRILIAFYLFLLAYQLGRGDVDVRHWLLVGNFSPGLQSEHSLLPYYWFIPNFLQTVLLYSLLFAVPAYRRAAREHPWETGLATLAAGFLAAIAARLILGRLGMNVDVGHFSTRTPIFLFYLFAFGWCLNFADNNRRRLLMTVAAIVMFLTIAVESFIVWLVVGSLVAMWIPRIRMPESLRKVVRWIAAASFYIFIAHMIPVQVLRSYPEPRGLLLIAATVVASVLLGMGLARVVHAIERILVRILVRRPRLGALTAEES